MVAAAADPAAYLVGGYVPPSKFSDWKYALHLPGAFTGSYSRNLNKLWALGSVVLLWAAPYVEFYFPGLSHGATHLAVDACTAPRAVAALEADGAAAARGGRGRVFDELLCADCLADFTSPPSRACGPTTRSALDGAATPPRSSAAGRALGPRPRRRPRLAALVRARPGPADDARPHGAVDCAALFQ
ncbi:hypothetical protein JL720_6982 [Aureococcus anophagefferens]|nr:hypothetical protein JL720_6982 [Aureococcus anophagefferens]